MSSQETPKNYADLNISVYFLISSKADINEQLLCVYTKSMQDKENVSEALSQNIYHRQFTEG